jgi:hypothetical protein
MMTLSMISFFAGAALAQRFKVMVLMPAIVIVVGLAVATGFAHVPTAWSVVLMAATAATCLQVGYLVGIGIRHFLVAALPQSTCSLASRKTPARRAAH